MCSRVKEKKPVAREGPKLQERGSNNILMEQTCREFLEGICLLIEMSVFGKGRGTPPLQSERRRKGRMIWGQLSGREGNDRLG